MSAKYWHKIVIIVSTSKKAEHYRGSASDLLLLSLVSHYNPARVGDDDESEFLMKRYLTPNIRYILIWTIPYCDIAVLPSFHFAILLDIAIHWYSGDDPIDQWSRATVIRYPRTGKKHIFVFFVFMVRAPVIRYPCTEEKKHICVFLYIYNPDSCNSISLH